MVAVLDDDFEFVKWLPGAVERAMTADTPRVTMGKRLISLNRPAVGLLLGFTPDNDSDHIVVDLFYDVAHGAVGIGLADPEGAGLVLGKRTENGKTWSVGAAAFLRHFGLTPLTAQRFNAWLERDGMIAFKARHGEDVSVSRRDDDDDIPF